MPFTVAHLTTVDMSLALLLEPQLLGVLAAGGEAIGISAAGPWVERLEADGVRHVALTSSTRGWNLLADFRAARQLWQVLRRERPTILHTHNPKPGVYGRIVGRCAGVPIVVNTVHGLYATETDHWKRRAAVYLLEAVASRFSDAELIQNEEDIATIQRFRLAARRKVRLLGNGIDLTRFTDPALAAGRAGVRREWGVGEDVVVIGTVGRLVAEKGYPELFEAVAGLADVPADPADRPADGPADGPADAQENATVLVVLGPHDPEKSDALNDDIVDGARASGVRFLGMRSDVARQLAGFDIFVLASHREGFPRAAMEAAAVGLPIVATNIRGCRQVVDDGVSGLLFPLGDVSALTSAMRRLVDDAALRRSMGLAARCKAECEFDERRIVSAVLSCYRDIARRKRIRIAGLT